MKRKPAILILAAGASKRMRGADKLLEQVEGEALLRRIARAAVQTGAPVYVALPPDRPARRLALADLAVKVVVVADAALGMSASIRAGVLAAQTAPGLMILPADMPELDGDDLRCLIAAFTQHPGQIWRATASDGTQGHPVVFPAGVMGDLAALQGDEGARQVLVRHAAQLSLLALPARHAITDLDTPEDWAAWRARNPAR